MKQKYTVLYQKLPWLCNFNSQTVVEAKAKPTMFQSGKTSISKTPKPVASPVLTKRQLELQKQVSLITSS